MSTLALLAIPGVRQDTALVELLRIQSQLAQASAGLERLLATRVESVDESLQHNMEATALRLEQLKADILGLIEQVRTPVIPPGK